MRTALRVQIAMVARVGCFVLLCVAGCARAGSDNGTTDAVQACSSGESRACYPGPASEPGVGACRAGMEQCVNGEWSACSGAQTSTTESCGDMIDNDCNGDIDNGCAC